MLTSTWRTLSSSRSALEAPEMPPTTISNAAARRNPSAGELRPSPFSCPSDLSTMAEIRSPRRGISRSEPLKSNKI
jgi:hypothetical protein